MEGYMARFAVDRVAPAA